VYNLRKKAIARSAKGGPDYRSLIKQSRSERPSLAVLRGIDVLGELMGIMKQLLTFTKTR
jgi:hypothetical protein